VNGNGNGNGALIGAEINGKLTVIRNISRYKSSCI
jgi:hypothetical protein